MLKNYLLITFLLVFLFSCNKGEDKLFRYLSSDDTGIDFVNIIEETDILNILNYEHFYNGSGVGAGDFNNDGLVDLYFTANMTSNRLYLNEGDLNFKDVTEIAGVQGMGSWSTGSSVVDINGDGMLDIYVCSSTLSGGTARRNLLYINNGLNEDDIPTFTESAVAYGIADQGSSMHAAFFDYDNDNDLDLYILTNELETQSPNKYQVKRRDGGSPGTDRLYQNTGIGPDGHPVYKNVSGRAGILIEGYGLGLNIRDINEDGWKDIYITNDYLTNDLLYINNQDGTFTNQIWKYVKHQSHSAMGSDIADINNDARPDIISLDMLPHHNQRQKRMMVETKYSNYINNQNLGYDYQYMRNMLQLNQGKAADGTVKFSEIGFFAGLHATEWSWTPLLADFDNDGYRDLFVSNGFPKDITDMDFSSYRNTRSVSFNRQEILDAIPEVKVSNFIFKNNADLTFSDETVGWGIDKPSYSNGAIFVDLDNDGDLDILVNNINEEVHFLENNLNKWEQQDANWLQIKLQYNKENPAGLGTKVWLILDNGKQLYEEYATSRGYLGSVDPTMHFGLGGTTIEKIKIEWPDGSIQNLGATSSNQVLTIKKENTTKPKNEAAKNYLFQRNNGENGMVLRHFEHTFIDFNIQRLLPHQLSQCGPAISVGDIDGNGEEDCYIGGSLAVQGAVFFQQDGKFQYKVIGADQDKNEEDLGTLLFDADNDGDLDLYAVSGSFEQAPNTRAYQDRLYLNDGSGYLKRNDRVLEPNFTSGSCVKAADFDKDGDLDLFVGGRVLPGSYPKAVSSFILKNELKEGKLSFKSDNANIAPMLDSIGMVTDATWTDFDNDGWMDLIITGEWMPLVFLKNNKGTFEKIDSPLDAKTGWWNSIASGDFDNDGDMDYIVGNLGLNSWYKASDEEPVTIYAHDFDKNGSFDPVMFNYLPDKDGVRKLYPMHPRDDLLKQLIMMKKRFLKYDDYAQATDQELFTPEERADALKLEANHLASSYIENKGNGSFEMRPLPTPAQFAPLLGILVQDFDHDGNLDALITGNDFSADLVIGRYDAMNGLLLKGNGDGTFESKNYTDTGFLTFGDAKALASLEGKNEEQIIIATINQDTLQVYNNTQSSLDYFIKIKPEPMDAFAIITLKNGKTQKHEFNYGSSYLSQPSRVLRLARDQVSKVELTDFNGNTRPWKIESLQ